MSLAKVEARRTGRSPLARSAATAMRFMSKALVKEMATQCVSKAICNGFNVMVTIPAGPLSAEFRRSSIPLLESGAIIRPKNYMGAINSRDGALTIILHHEMVDLIIRNHIVMAREQAEKRLGKYSKHLSRGLARSLPEGAFGEVTLSIDNLNSTGEMSCKAAVSDLTGFRTTIDYPISRDLLSLLRRVIAPLNLKEAATEVSFDAIGDGLVFLSVNGVNLDPVTEVQIASVTTEDDGRVAPEREESRTAYNFSIFN
jgi:hypothetical protein